MANNTLAIIPARGGSLELRRKNLLPIAGVPMFLRSAQAAKDAGCEVVVSTDDPEIRSTAVVAGFQVHDRGPELADVVVDEVVKAAAEGWGGAVLLVQPTVQPITANVLTNLMKSPLPASLGQNSTHQLAHNGEWITQHANRQDRTDTPPIQELGVRWWPDGDAGVDVAGFVMVSGLVDIDNVQDYRSAIIPKRIAIWPIADQTHGKGHLRRCLAIAEQLQHHDIIFITNDCDNDTKLQITVRGWRTGTQSVRPDNDLWILDRLDNTNMSHLDGRVVTFEDESSYPADLVVNALYKPNVVETGSTYKLRLVGGVDWCVLRPEFMAGDYEVSQRVKRILVMFGGTDPSGLGERVKNLFTFNCLRLDPDGSYRVAPTVDWIKAGDDRSVAEAMHAADILITSAGRTVFEAAAVGIPTIVLAQNLRETTHTHVGFAHGNIDLGLGKLVSDKVIVDTVDTLSYNRGLRQELSERGRPDGLGLDRIVHAVEGLLGGL